MDRMVRKSRPSRRALTAAELRRRAAHIRLVLTDSDGVLTDTGVYYGDAGELMKRFSIRDGMGVELLREAGIETGIITGELSGSVRTRAEKLRLKHCYLGVKDKRAQLAEILERVGMGLEAIAYIGDDVNDLGILNEVLTRGLVGAPGDAMPAVARLVHFRSRARGGHGAFREFAEWILALRAPRQQR
jgi:3-deoxy-D-manno-octulosonate 8-phosphate phosphatase (KDO 8-P phosphatase)